MSTRSNRQLGFLRRGRAVSSLDRSRERGKEKERNGERAARRPCTLMYLSPSLFIGNDLYVIMARLSSAEVRALRRGSTFHRNAATCILETLTAAIESEECHLVSSAPISAYFRVTSGACGLMEHLRWMGSWPADFGTWFRLGVGLGALGAWFSWIII